MAAGDRPTKTGEELQRLLRHNTDRVTEIELADRAVEGEHEAGLRLLRANLDELRSFIERQVSHPEDAKDVLEETLATCIRELSEFDYSAPFREFARAIASKVIARHLERAGDTDILY